MAYGCGLLSKLTFIIFDTTATGGNTTGGGCGLLSKLTFIIFDTTF